MINFISFVKSLNMNVSKKDFSNVEDSADVLNYAETLQLELHYLQQLEGCSWLNDDVKNIKFALR